MAKILRIVGARPQFMQVPTVRSRLQELGHDEVLLHTGQHYDSAMSNDIFASLELPAPDITLDVGPGPQGRQTGAMIGAIEEVLERERPDGVLVDGDTNSTLAGAIATNKLHIPLFHIEGGHRSGYRKQPEEINRILTDHCSEVNFTPTSEAQESLNAEGLGHTGVFSGDVLLDCLLKYRSRITTGICTRFNVAPKNFAIVTIHRADNTTHPGGRERFFTILKGLARLPMPVLFPVHPRTKMLVENYLADGGSLGSIRLIDPLPYLTMIGLLAEAGLCLTDSGGLQRESLWLGIPTAVTIEHNVWPQFVDNGWVYNPPFTVEAIALSHLRAPRINPDEVIAYSGGGRASQVIAGEIDRRLTQI